EVIRLEQQALIERHLQTLIDGFQRETHGQRAHREDTPHHLLGFGEQVGGRDDLIDEPDPVGLLRVDHLPGQNQLHRNAFPHQPWQPLRAAVAGRDTELYFGLPELRVLARDADVARHRQLAAAAEGEPVDRGDDGFAARLETPQDALAALRARLAVEWSLAREVADVGAGDERFRARAGDDGALDSEVGGDAL